MSDGATPSNLRGAICHVICSTMCGCTSSGLRDGTHSCVRSCLDKLYIQQGWQTCLLA